MDLLNMFVICGIPDMQNPAGNHLGQLFIDSQGSTILPTKIVPHMIKDHNLVTNQEARLGAI